MYCDKTARPGLKHWFICRCQRPRQPPAPHSDADGGRGLGDPVQRSGHLPCGEERGAPHQKLAQPDPGVVGSGLNHAGPSRECLRYIALRLFVLLQAKCSWFLGMN
jgi:hypothetical protein